jgi:hypothetical protein
VRHKGITPSTGTGPSVDHTLGLYFLIIIKLIFKYLLSRVFFKKGTSFGTYIYFESKHNFSEFINIISYKFSKK